VTVVVLMGGAGRAGIRDALVAAGWSPATPAAIVVNASHPDQRVWTGELDRIDTQTAGPHADEAAVLIIGQVVSIATAAALTRPFVSEETPWQPSTIQRR
jgi:siroheme synthase